MKKIKLTIVALIVSASALGQIKAQYKPKTHIYYDTIKTVKERIDYSPDTIPVFFKELIFTTSEATEKWQAGFIIWNTYVKRNYSPWISTNRSVFITNSEEPEYYKVEFRQSDTLDDKFIYADRKTKVTNRFLMYFKR
jgi:hypothetical protein